MSKKLPPEEKLRRIVERTRQWRIKNPEKAREKSRKSAAGYRARHRDHVNAKNRTFLRQYHKKHPHKKYQYNYKLSEEDALRLYRLADTGPCELCGATGRMHFDHNHATGKFRGLLCVRCNQGLGRFRDNADLLELAAKYVRERG